MLENIKTFTSVPCIIHRRYPHWGYTIFHSNGLHCFYDYEAISYFAYVSHTQKNRIRIKCVYPKGVVRYYLWWYTILINKCMKLTVWEIATTQMDDKSLVKIGARHLFVYKWYSIRGFGWRFPIKRDLTLVFRQFFWKGAWYKNSLAKLPFVELDDRTPRQNSFLSNPA